MSPWKPERHLLGNLYIITLGTLRTFTWKTWEPWGNLYNTTLGTLTTFTWETWESWGNLYNATLESLRKPWQYNLGTLENLYNVTLGTLREPLQYNLGNLGKLGNLQGTLRKPSRNLQGTLKKPWGNLDNLTLGYLGNLIETFTMSPWEPGPRLLGNLYIIIFGTLTTFTWKTWEPCREPWRNLEGLEGTFWEPFWNLEGTLRNLGNLYLGTFKWEPLLGTWEPWGNGFWSCSGLLRNLYYGWRPQSILLLGKNTQTYLNKQTMSWCKDFLWRHVFLIAFVKLTERCQLATPHLFCVKEWHINKNHSDMSRDISVSCLCAVKVAELWDWLTWLRGRSFGLLRTMSWTLTQVGLEVSKVCILGKLETFTLYPCTVGKLEETLTM